MIDSCDWQLSEIVNLIRNIVKDILWPNSYRGANVAASWLKLAGSS